MGSTCLGGEELGELIEISLPSILLELLSQLLSIILGASIELLHLLGSDDAVVIVINDPQETLAEVLITCIGKDLRISLTRVEMTKA